MEMGEKRMLEDITWFIPLLLLIPLFTLKPQPIIETHNIAKMLSHVNKNTLVLLDIDNTIIELTQTLGTPQWFSIYYQQKIKEGMTHEQAMKETVHIYVKVNHLSNAKPVDTKTAKIIKNLQKKGITILGLTSRDDSLFETTIKHLSFAEVDFNTGKFKNFATKLTSGDRSKVQNGIIFTGGQNKGDCLIDFLSKVQWYPKKVLFVDDQLKNIKEVHQGLKKVNIPFKGIRYSFLDEKLKNINHHIPAIQLECLAKSNKLLSDEEALLILKKLPTATLADKSGSCLLP